MTESFEFRETADTKQLVVTFPADTDVTEAEACEAIRSLVDSAEPTEARDSAPRQFARGYESGGGWA